MSKGLKVLLSVLALIVISFSLLYYFNLMPFLKKEVETTNNNNNVTSQTANEDRSIALPKSKTPVNCVILDKENCALGKPIYENNQIAAVGFNLPKGSRVYAPFKTKYEKDAPIFFTIINRDKAYPSVEFLDISKNDWESNQTRSYFSVVAYSHTPITTETLLRGQTIMVLKETGKVQGDYNLILTFKEYDVKANQWRTNLDLLKQFFPYLESK